MQFDHTDVRLTLNLACRVVARSNPDKTPSKFKFHEPQTFTKHNSALSTIITFSKYLELSRFLFFDELYEAAVLYLAIYLVPGTFNLLLYFIRCLLLWLQNGYACQTVAGHPGTHIYLLEKEALMI